MCHEYKVYNTIVAIVYISTIEHWEQWRDDKQAASTPSPSFTPRHPDHSASFGCMILVLKQLLEIIFKKQTFLIRFYLNHEFKSVI